MPHDAPERSNRVEGGCSEAAPEEDIVIDNARDYRTFGVQSSYRKYPAKSTQLHSRGKRKCIKFSFGTKLEDNLGGMCPHMSPIATPLPPEYPNRHSATLELVGVMSENHPNLLVTRLQPNTTGYLRHSATLELVGVMSENHPNLLQQPDTSTANNQLSQRSSQPTNINM